MPGAIFNIAEPVVALMLANSRSITRLGTPVVWNAPWRSRESSHANLSAPRESGGATGGAGSEPEYPAGHSPLPFAIPHVTNQRIP